MTKRRIVLLLIPVLLLGGCAAPIPGPEPEPCQVPPEEGEEPDGGVGGTGYAPEGCVPRASSA